MVAVGDDDRRVERVVVKAGGSGLFVRTTYSSPVPWDAYRRYRLDGTYFAGLVDALARTPVTHRVLFVPGGAGAYLYIGVAEAIGLDRRSRQRVGCGVVNLIGEMIVAALLARGADVHPRLVSHHRDLVVLARRSRILVMEASADLVSTDALAAWAATAVDASRLAFFKQGVPRYFLGFDTPTIAHELSTNQIRRMVVAVEERPGQNAILDSECLRLIERGRIPTVLYAASDLVRLPEILASGTWASSTRITIDDA